MEDRLLIADNFAAQFDIKVLERNSEQVGAMKSFQNLGIRCNRPSVRNPFEISRDIHGVETKPG